MGARARPQPISVSASVRNRATTSSSQMLSVTGHLYVAARVYGFLLDRRRTGRPGHDRIRIPYSFKQGTKDKLREPKRGVKHLAWSGSVGYCLVGSIILFRKKTPTCGWFKCSRSSIYQLDRSVWIPSRGRLGYFYPTGTMCPNQYMRVPSCIF